MSVQEVINEVSRHYGVSVEAVLSPMRYQDLCDCRTVICWALYELCGRKLDDIGQALNRSHGTVVYHVHKANDWYANAKLNPKGASVMHDIERTIRP